MVRNTKGIFLRWNSAMRRVHDVLRRIPGKRKLILRNSGASGGGFMMIYCRFDKRHKVAGRLEQLGGEIIDFQFEEKGVQTWHMAK